MCAASLSVQRRGEGKCKQAMLYDSNSRQATAEPFKIWDCLYSTMQYCVHRNLSGQVKLTCQSSVERVVGWKQRNLLLGRVLKSTLNYMVIDIVAKGPVATAKRRATLANRQNSFRASQCRQSRNFSTRKRMRSLENLNAKWGKGQNAVLEHSLQKSSWILIEKSSGSNACTARTANDQILKNARICIRPRSPNKKEHDCDRIDLSASP